MKLTSTAFQNGRPIPPKYAFCKQDPKTHAAMSDNLSPPLAWEDVPAGTRSFAIVVHDPDVPSRPDDVNQEGRTVPADLPRVEFFHWALTDLAPGTRGLDEGAFSEGITPRGKEGPQGPHGTRAGLNDYTGWFEGDADMEGRYFGYDGPCPPWNDARLHHYHFTRYALDVETSPVEGVFTGPDLRTSIEGHVLAKAELIGTYTLNPDVKG